MNLRIKIVIETERLLTMRGRVKIHMWCGECRAETDFVTDDDFQRLFLNSKENIQTENLHRLRTIEGTMLICLESVPKKGT